MEIILGLIVVVVVGALIYFNRSARSLDINKDGKVDLVDAVAAAVNVTEGVKQTAKKAAVKAKTATRSSARKSSSAKPAAKKPKTAKK